MSLSSILAINPANGQPKTYVGATPTNQGSAPVAGETNSTTGQSQLLNTSCILVLNGYQTWFAVMGGQIWKTTNAGSTWTSVHTLANIIGTQQGAHSGLHAIDSTGTLNLALIYNNITTGNYYGVYSTDLGATWTETAPVASPGSYSIGQFFDRMVHHGKLYAAGWNDGHNSAEVAVFDPNGHALTITTGLGGVVSTPGGLCSFNGSIYLLVGDGTNAKVYTLSGTTWGSAITLGAASGGSTLNAWEIFADTTANVMVAIANSGATWVAWKIDTSNTVTSINAIIPAAFNSTTGRVKCACDLLAAPGTEPQKWIAWAVDGTSGTNWNFYQYTNPTTLMTLDTTGGNVQDYMGFAKWSAGNTFWESGDDRSERPTCVGIPGGIRISFKLFSSTGTDTVSMRVWWKKSADSYMTRTATLVNPSSGSLSGNTVTGLVADNATTYTVDWRCITDGVHPNDLVGFIVEQF